MPRNTGGTYTRPASNPVSTGTTITSNWANETTSDIATELTNSLDRGGRGGMAAPLQLADGTAAAPGLTFVTDADLGFYRAGANDMRAVALATALQTWTPTRVGFGVNVAVTGNLSATGTLAITGQSTLTGNVGMSGALTVTGAIAGSSTLGVSGNGSVGGTLAVTGTASAATPTLAAHLTRKDYVDLRAATALVNFDVSAAGAITINSQLNVSSVTDVSSGGISRYQINFTTALSGTTYIVTATGDDVDVSGAIDWYPGTKNTTSVRVSAGVVLGAGNSGRVSVAVFGPP